MLPLLDAKPFNSLEEPDLRQLIDFEVSEGQRIDYKLGLFATGKDMWTTDIKLLLEPKRIEFFADIASFANAEGGYIIFGVKEEGGIAKELVGIDIDDNEALENNLRNHIFSNIEPRIPSLAFRFVRLESNKCVLILRIGRSWLRPHIINYADSLKFIYRVGTQKRSIPYRELRRQFTESTSLSTQLAAIRNERLTEIISGHTPYELRQEPTFVFHLIPFSISDVGSRFDISFMEGVYSKLSPFSTSISSSRFNADGFMTYYIDDERKAYSYAQLYRSGMIETVTTKTRKNKDSIWGGYIEGVIYRGLNDYYDILRRMEVEPPFYCSLALFGANGLKMVVPGDFEPSNSFDRDMIMFEPSVIESYESNIEDALTPTFNSLWNSAGYSQWIRPPKVKT